MVSTFVLKMLRECDVLRSWLFKLRVEVKSEEKANRK